MKKLFMIIGFSVALLQGAAQEVDLVKEYGFYANKQVTYDSNSMGFKSFALVDGDYLVFEFTSNNAGDSGNYSMAESQIIFQIDQTSYSFKITGEQIAARQGLYMQKCRCQDKGIQMIKEGQISGVLLDSGSWKIDMDVRFNGARTGKEYHVQESAVFDQKK